MPYYYYQNEMLQFITYPQGNLSPVDQAEKAVEGGCVWIELASGETMEADARALVERFKGQDIFLILQDNVRLVDELRVHGVALSSADPKHVAETRETLGAHAVIGVRVTSAEEAAALRAIDVDYIIYGVPADEEAAVAAWNKFRQALDEAAVPFHAVASGEFAPSAAASLRAAGAAGVAVSGPIATAQDPANETRLYIEALKRE